MKKIFSPTNLDIDKVILMSNNQYYSSSTWKFEKYDFDLNKLNSESIYYVIYLILKRTINGLNVKDNKEKTKYVKNGKFIYNDYYIDLPSTELQSIDRDYHKIMKFLSNKHINYENVLFRSNYKNGKTFSYSLNYKFLNSEIKIINISRLSIIRHVNKNNVASISGSEINTKLKHLKNDFLNKFRIDFDILPTLILHENIISEYSSIISLFEYNNGKRWLSINNNTDGRLHTNFTNLSKKYRKLITNDKGDKFVEIDIGSCIPFLFLLSIIYRSDLKIFISLNKNLILYQQIFDDIYKRFIQDKIEEVLINEIVKFYDLIKNDNLYSNFQKTKQDVLSIFFCKNGAKLNVENQFKELYPNLFYYLSKLKDNRTWIDRYKYPPYENSNKILAHYLFHLESSIVIYKVVDEIKKFNKKIEIITIHDCIMVPEHYVGEVKSIMEKVFDDNFKIAPNIKIKNL
ncbi:hypothetical protein ACTS94_11000 [Empedobacter falsenii]